MHFLHLKPKGFVRDCNGFKTQRVECIFQINEDMIQFENQIPYHVNVA